MRMRWRELLGGAEVGGNSPTAPNWGMASRSDDPVTSGGAAVAATVQRASNAARDHAVETRIRRRKRELTPVLEELFQSYASGGMLVVAAIEVIPMGEMQAYSFRYMETTAGVYRRPRHAVARWRRHARLETPRRGASMAYRFFWVTRA
jgi:hypothetical protein